MLSPPQPPSDPLAGGRDRLETEFGQYAGWLAQTIADISLEDPIPAACRGTGNPALFERMASHLGARPGMRVLDVGCGIGGPGAWLMAERGCRVIGTDVMRPAISGLKLLFPHFPAVVASIDEPAFGPETFDGAWMLGVLEVLDDKQRALAALHDVVRPGGRVAIYSFVIVVDEIDDVPEVDIFERAQDVIETATSIGFRVTHAAKIADLPPAPSEWRERTTRVRERLWELHPDDPRLERVEFDIARISRICTSDEVEPWEFVLEKGAR
ncbi:MAG TPA: class I SAM-dependent methyltransferase [Actinomycetota bacterium]|nr:class I SAM-dependent methyltransferase [Actinomycetota bacterium]